MRKTGISVSLCYTAVSLGQLLHINMSIISSFQINTIMYVCPLRKQKIALVVIQCQDDT